jgi:hypothetical protein
MPERNSAAEDIRAHRLEFSVQGIGIPAPADLVGIAG